MRCIASFSSSNITILPLISTLLPDAAHRLAHGVQGSEADQSIAGADIEVDVRQRLYLLEALQLGDQLQEEAQLAYLHGLAHDVHAVEVV